MAKNRASKQAKATIQPQVGGGERTPKAAVRPYAELGVARPIFSFQYADRTYVGKWPWPTGDESGELLEFLCEIGRLTWNEIRAQTTGGRDRHRKHHEMGFDSVCREAGERISLLGHDEVFEELFRFRLAGRKRLWGYINGPVFYVLWWDAAHAVYPTDRD